MVTYTVRRLIQAIPILFGISLVAFAMINLAPGSPVDRFQTGHVSHQTIQNLIHLYGLDQPLPVRYVKWITAFVQFWRLDAWGYSFVDGLPVTQKIFDRIPSTLELMGTALGVTVLFAVPIGILAAVRQYSWADKIITTFATIGYAMPSFWLGLLLLFVFAVELGWFPLFGKYTFGQEGDPLNLVWHLVLPVASLAIQQIAGWSRYMRSSMLEVMHQDYIRTAKAKGLPESGVIYRHALRNALIPIITLLGLTVPSLLAGAAITETIFSWPGLGYLLVSSVNTRDYPVVLALTMMGGFMVIAGNLLADILYAVVDPRIKY